MLEAVNLGCARGERRLFSNLNFSVTPGTLLQLVGPNGSGKTSLLRMLCGLLAPEEGEIRWQGENIRSLGEEYFSDLIYIGHRNGLKEELSSLENLTISAGLAGREVSHDKARNILGKMGLDGRENLPARLLSEGQRRRSALARLLSWSSSLWLLDEVLTSLDQAAVVLMKTLIEDHLGSGGMAIVATHQDLNLSSGKFERLELAPGIPGGVAPLGRAS
jgi:heme exporter protein A